MDISSDIRTSSGGRSAARDEATQPNSDETRGNDEDDNEDNYHTSFLSRPILSLDELMRDIAIDVCNGRHFDELRKWLLVKELIAHGDEISFSCQLAESSWSQVPHRKEV
jgi:hypothetical protein